MEKHKPDIFQQPIGAQIDDLDSKLDKVTMDLNRALDIAHVSSSEEIEHSLEFATFREPLTESSIWINNGNTSMVYFLDSDPDLRRNVGDALLASLAGMDDEALFQGMDPDEQKTARAYAAQKVASLLAESALPGSPAEKALLTAGARRG